MKPSSQVTTARATPARTAGTASCAHEPRAPARRSRRATGVCSLTVPRRPRRRRATSGPFLDRVINRQWQAAHCRPHPHQSVGGSARASTLAAARRRRYAIRLPFHCHFAEGTPHASPECRDLSQTRDSGSTPQASATSASLVCSPGLAPAAPRRRPPPPRERAHRGRRPQTRTRHRRQLLRSAPKRTSRWMTLSFN